MKSFPGMRRGRKRAEEKAGQTPPSTICDSNCLAMSTLGNLNSFPFIVNNVVTTKIH